MEATVKSGTFRYLGVIIYPFIVSVLCVLLWQVLRSNGIYFSAEAETPILYVIIPPVGFIYVIFASLAVNSVFDKYKEINQSIVRKDIKEYIARRDQRLPALMHLLVSVPSLVLLFLVITYNYSDFYGGMASVFLVTLVISITWMVINELDNDHQRPHAKARIPSHWHTTKMKTD